MTQTGNTMLTNRLHMQASTPAFGQASTPAFGQASSPAFGGSAFGQTPNAFGASSGGLFGKAASTPAFGQSSSPFGGAFGAASTPAFGAASTPAFGGSTPAFGSSGKGMLQTLEVVCREYLLTIIPVLAIE